MLAYRAFLRYVCHVFRMNGQIQDIRTVAEILGLSLQRIYVGSRIIMAMEGIGLSLTDCCVCSIAQYRMEKDVVCSDTVTSVNSCYGIVEHTSCGDALSVEGEGVTYALMYVNSYVWHRTNSQVQNTNRVATRLSCLQRVVVGAACCSAFASEHHVFTLADVLIDMYFR